MENFKNQDEAEKKIEFKLSFKYEERKKQALDNAEGVIKKGQCIVLCGGSGCGKSTVLRCINRLIPRFYDGELRGFCRINSEDIGNLSIGETGRLAASVFQDPRSQFFTVNSSTEIAFGLENFGFSHEEILKRTEEAFVKFNLGGLKDRNVFSLSSGQRQLVAVLSAWAMDTDIFLLDEPAANLDHASTEQLGRLLKSLKDEGKTLVVSEHRLSYLSEAADEYWLVEDGKITKKIPAAEMLALSDGELNKMGLRTTVTDRVAQKDKSLQLEETASFISEKDRHVVRAENICFSYNKGSEKILNGINAEIKTGEILGVTGANGCGKTTLGKITAGLCKMSSGKIYFDGKELKKKELTDKSIFIMQEAEFQFFTNSVLNELTYGLPQAKKKMPQIEEILKAMGLWKLRNRHPFSLSGGQMQKLVLAMAYLSPKPMVILDEPTAGLDYMSLQVCAELIRKMSRTKAVIIITHDIELIGEVCTRCIGVENGVVKRSFDLLKDEDFESVKGFVSEDTGVSHKKPQKTNKHKPRLDPRTKMFMIIISMIIGVGTNITLMLTAFIAVMAAALYERRLKVFAVSTGLMAAVFVAYTAFPCVAFSFIAGFFPRVFLICSSVSLVISEEEVPRTVAGLRKLHIPEKVIMVFSVVFRFFPILHLDIGMMKQSIKTRGFFSEYASKIKAIPEYAEIMIVPMVFRVIRIAEALSASAETRGIALKGKRENYVLIKAGAADICMLLLFTAGIAAGLLI